MLAALTGERLLAESEVAFLRSHIARRTRSGITERDMLAVVRIFERVLWDAIVEFAGYDDRDAALRLTRPLLEHVDALSRAVCTAFTAAVAVDSLRRGSDERSELARCLLRGEWPRSGRQHELIRRLGLDANRKLIVISACVHGSAPSEDTLLLGCLRLARATSRKHETLAAPIDGEIVVLSTIEPAELTGVISSVRHAVSELKLGGISMAAGISTLRNGRLDVPEAYAEACLARSRVVGTGVLALGELNAADYLLLKGADTTAWQLLPAAAREFVAGDAGAGGTLSDTLLAYIGADMSVRLAADRLFVHPNTVHYRLARIEERTGLCVRRLADVLTLAIAIRLLRANSPATS